jgi:hypothetical protein
MFTDWPPILGPEDWDWGDSELEIAWGSETYLPPRLLVDARLLTVIYLYGEHRATFQMTTADSGYVGGVLKIRQDGGWLVYRVTGWEHAIGALYCEWPD